MEKNVRVLEGALTRLFAFATLVGREITLDMAHEWTLLFTTRVDC